MGPAALPFSGTDSLSDPPEVEIRVPIPYVPSYWEKDCWLKRGTVKDTVLLSNRPRVRTTLILSVAS